MGQKTGRRDACLDRVDPAVLVCRIRAGDRAAEDELVMAYHPSVLLQLRWRVRDWEAARELTDDVLMGVVKAVRFGRVLDASKIGAFIRGTARNVANNHIRARLARPAEPVRAHPYALAAEADPMTLLEQREQRAAVRTCMDRLGHLERQVLLMSVFDGFKPGRIAFDLGLTPEVVRARKSRAIRKLLACLRSGEAPPAGS